MNKLKFTQGNWTIATQTDLQTKTLVLGGDNGVVADCAMSWRIKEENEANAQLVANAPKMYEALKEQEDYLKSIKWTVESLTDESAKRVLLMHYYSIEELRTKALEDLENGERNG